MRIVVYDIAAKKGGGGEAILDQYFQKAMDGSPDEWWFIVSQKKYLKSAGRHIHVLCVDLTGCSKLREYLVRKKYEVFSLGRMLNKIQPDEVISLQNMPVPGVKCRQTVYLHQSLQFSPVKYRFHIKEERSLAFRQRVICSFIRKNLHKADKVIVQTNWMKKSVSEWAGYPMNDIVVETPQVDVSSIKERADKANNLFFFPANAYLNKNHRVILDACRILKRQGIKDYRVEFTLSDQGGLASGIFSEVERDNLPVAFIGRLEKREVFLKYQTAVLLFPSYIETFGMPLLEAKMMKGTIIASNMPFSHEILDDYENAVFADWNDADAWANAMKHIISGRK